VLAHKIPELTLLCRREHVYRFLEDRIGRALVDVSSWERVKKFAILAEPFSVAAEELTVSLKLRRQVVLERHQATLAALYDISME